MARQRYTFRLEPTRRQERLLIEQLRFTRELYKAALEQRITAYELTGRSVLEPTAAPTRLKR